MSRVTRSSSNTYAANDENAAPTHKPLRSGTSGGLKNSLKSVTGGLSKATKPVTRNSRTRQVLGDISNNIRSSTAGEAKADRMAKKKRAVEAEKPAPVEVEKPMEVPQPETSSLKGVFEDVDMKESPATSLEASVADLSLSPVDAADANDPVMVAEYINDIMVYLKKIEGLRAPSPSYMAKQLDINARMREILIDWLVEVHFKFKLQRETLFLTVNLIDRFLERRAVSRTKLQLVGCTAMLIASKYEEIYAPEVRDFVYISDRAYTKDQILAMESIMLNTLGFHITVPSTLRFGERFSKVAECSEQQVHLINFLMELTCQEYKFLNYLPSIIASSAVYLAHLMTNAPKAWTPMLVQHTGYEEDALRACITDLYDLASKQPTKYRAVRKKYATSKFDEVSSIPVVRPDFVPIEAV